MEHFDKIEDYLAGRLSPDDAKAFRSEVARNPELKDALKAHELALESMEVIIEDNLRKELTRLQGEVYPKVVSKNAEREEQPGSGKTVTLGRLWPRIAIAASILLLIGFATTRWAGSNYTSEAIAGNYYNSLQQNGLRGSGVDSPLKEGFDFLDRQEYSAAARYFQSVPKDNDYYLSAQYYLGRSLFEQGKTTEAITVLEKLAAGSDANLAEEAEWLSLIILLNDQQSKDDRFTKLLNKMIDNKDHSYHNKAIELQRKLRSFWRKITG